MRRRRHSQAATASGRHRLSETVTKCGSSFGVAFDKSGSHVLGSAVWISGIEWRRRIVFDTELNGPGGRLAGDFRDHAETEVDPRGHAACGNQIAVPDDSFLPFHASPRPEATIPCRPSVSSPVL